jgi:ribonucleotide monophosphatase NagD (HAD superfamily)
VGLSPSTFHYKALNKAFRILHKHSTRDDDIESSSEQQQQHPPSQHRHPVNPHRLLCFHRSKYLKDSDGELSLGPGGFVTCLEHAVSSGRCNITAHVLGKPSREFYQAALARLLAAGPASSVEEQEEQGDTTASCTVMVGDDYLNDILGAREAGIGHQILVQTGKYQKGDEDRCRCGNNNNDDDAGFVMAPSIVQAVDYILDHVAGNGSAS